MSTSGGGGERPGKRNEGRAEEGGEERPNRERPNRIIRRVRRAITTLPRRNPASGGREGGKDARAGDSSGKVRKVCKSVRCKGIYEAQVSARASHAGRESLLLPRGGSSSGGGGGWDEEVVAIRGAPG